MIIFRTIHSGIPVGHVWLMCLAAAIFASLIAVWIDRATERRRDRLAGFDVPGPDPAGPAAYWTPLPDDATRPQRQVQP